MFDRKILISGCSYTANAVWPSLLFPDCNITNLGKSGAGNKYISDSIIKFIDPTNPPDGVMVLFSGVNRSEVVVPLNSYTEKFAEQYKYYGIVNDSIYFFSGGDKYNQQVVNDFNNIKSQNWPNIHSVLDFLKLPSEIKQECVESGIFFHTNYDIGQLVHSSLMINYLSSETFAKNQTYYSILNLQTFLERYNIPYIFGIFYDAFNDIYSNQFGCISKTDKLAKQINWDKFLYVFPFDTGLEYNLLDTDNALIAHLSVKGQEFWANKIKYRVNMEINNEKPFLSKIFKYF